MEYNEKKIFNRNYVDYWKCRVETLQDGTKISDEKIISYFLDMLSIKKTHIVLDLGCGHGRLFPVINSYTEEVIGSDISYAAIDEASKFSYKFLLRGKAEETNLPKSYLDRVIAWAVFDAVDQNRALLELNRILRKGAFILFTGKNCNYHIDDKKAFIAERNARLKRFPNHFTDVNKLQKLSIQFGFKVMKVFVFPRRGDFGNNISIPIEKFKEQYYYEFLIILKKIGEPQKTKLSICSEYSKTAKKIAKIHNFVDIDKFFAWHKDTYGDK